MSKNYPGDDSRDHQMEAIAQQLPDDHRILDAAYSALIDFNNACMIDDPQQRHDAVYRYEVCIWKMNGKTFFGCNAGEHEAAHVVSEYCRADNGCVPMWGQNGDFIIESFSGMRARVKVEAECMIGHLSTSFHAVDLGAPFVSETGYRSHYVQLSNVKLGETVDVYVSRVFQSMIDARKKPAFIAADSRDRLASDLLPDWLKSISPPPDRTPLTLPDGFVRVEALLPASKAFIARKWSVAAQKRITDIMQLEREAERETMRAESERRNQLPKEYKDRMITVQRYKEFYVGARCEIVSVHHPVFAKNIGTIVKIVTIYDSGRVEAFEDKPIRYRINRRGIQVVDFDPTCVRTFYNVDQLKLLEDNKTGES
ncbi:protein klcB [Lonsdalea quercina]|uniref:protein klcB n=1 Tax=Lonsdalea quercina TaxID=71657 RepID=UPI0039753754